jgi:hypothetical protein
MCVYKNLIFAYIIFFASAVHENLVLCVLLLEVNIMYLCSSGYDVL